jgi:hypothetical protein
MNKKKKKNVTQNNRNRIINRRYSTTIKLYLNYLPLK